MTSGASLTKVFAQKNDLNFQLYLFSLNPYAVEESDDGLTFFFYKQNLPTGLGEEVEIHSPSLKRERTKYFWLVRVRVLNRPKAVKRNRYIHILKGGAFGTAEHGTTRACIYLLLFLRKYQKKFEYVLDFGAGTGILGFIAERFFSAKVLFSEIDPIAINNLKQNIKLNHSKGQLVNIKDCFEAELILANVYSQTLINCSNMLLKKRPKWVIASGFKKLEEIKLFLSSFEVVKCIAVGSWLAVLLKGVK